MSSFVLEDFDKEKCIICQFSDDLTSTSNGCNKIRLAAEQRKDIVLKRLKTLDSNELFFYHMSNSCYKIYTDKNKCKRASAKVAEQNDPVQNVEADCASIQTVSRITRCKVNQGKKVCDSASNKNPVCIVCGFSKHKNDDKLYRICEKERAQSFIKIITFFRDDFIRCSHLQDAEDVFAADIFYHKNCLRKYELKYAESQTNNSCMQPADQLSMSLDVNDDIVVIKEETIAYIMNDVIPRIKEREIFTISSIRDRINKECNSHIQIKNSDIKSYLDEYYGDIVQFSVPSDKKKSTLVYSNDISLEDIIENLQPRNIIAESAKLIKNKLNEVDFDLNDKFYDKANLKASWENTKIPQELLLFYSVLFNFKENDFYSEQKNSEESKEIILSKSKILKINSLFQTMFYISKNGLSKTPLHIMNGLAIYTSCKSKSLIESLNHTGLSISYDEILRCKTNLASYTIESCGDNIPIPSHFVKSKFTKGAFDNFDHNEATQSGLNSTHDTVCVLFQESSNSTLAIKPNISETTVSKTCRSLDQHLKCQTLLNFYKPANSISLASTVNETTANETTVNDLLVNHESYESLSKLDFLWSMCRMDISNNSLTSKKNSQTTPNWSAFNSYLTVDDVPIQEVAFLPMLPFPVTEYSTVYTAMCNYKNILSQLDQKYFPLFCDEGVYRIARHIQLLRQEEFKDITLMLGSFHLTKILLACIGKYLKDSGLEYILIETGLFGANVVSQIMSGSHYSRCVKAFFIFGEALQRLQLEAFLNEQDLSKYDNELTDISTLQDLLAENNFDESRSLFQKMQELHSEIFTDLKQFVQKRCQESSLFKYYNNVLIMIQLARDLVRADRFGDWNLHVSSIKKALPIFRIFDRYNYTRWTSLYAKDILELPSTKPELHKEFLAGNFVFKRSAVAGTSVGPDQGLEQSINRSQKSSAGLIGSTQQKNYVAAWNLTYHELLAVKNYYREITNVKLENDELQVHHEHSLTLTNRAEEQVDLVIDYIEKHCNPFKNGEEQLRNIITEELTTNESAESLLNIYENGCKLYKEFYNERFVNKNVALSSIISRINLPSLRLIQTASNLKNTKSTISKENKIAQRLVDLAKERRYDLKKLFSYELLTSNSLFDEDGLMRKEKNKSDLVKELEKRYLKETYEPPTNFTEFNIIVDVMLKLRERKWKNLNNFEDYASRFCKTISTISRNQSSRIDFVFDSYVKESIKSNERFMRYKDQPINMQDIDKRTPLPKQEELFWPSDMNKTLLQKFIREYVLEKSIENWPGAKIVCSGTNELPCQDNVSMSTLSILQRNDIEEADSRIVLHAYQSCLEGTKKILVLSSDTDVVVLLLYYWAILEEKGLQELWIEVGAGAKKRILPVHILAKKCGIKLCSVLPAIHHLTGADYTSKVGTKNAGMNNKPEEYLIDFAKSTNSNDLENSLKKAEEYLVKVVKKTCELATFDEFRLWSYNRGICTTVFELPPTSNSIRLHILRALFVTHQQINILNEEANKLKPEFFGYELENGYIVPKKVPLQYPPIDDLIPNCNCKNCSRKSCACKSAGLSCISFCKCRTDNSCENPYNNNVNNNN